MNRAAAWSVRGVGRETRDIAEEAARRAGMSLGDWLDEVVAEQAADQGISVDDLDEDDKLDAIGDRLSRLSRHPAAVRRDAGGERRAARPGAERAGGGQSGSPRRPARPRIVSPFPPRTRSRSSPTGRRRGQTAPASRAEATRR